MVNRLQRVQAIPFVTLWDSTGATLYVGVNRHGDPGLHFRQKRDDRGTRARIALTRDGVNAPSSARSARKTGSR